MLYIIIIIMNNGKNVYIRRPRREKKQIITDMFFSLVSQFILGIINCYLLLVLLVVLHPLIGSQVVTRVLHCL